ncbi:heme-binding protein 2-like [Eriocheir sinensis]|uniref:heme-binding protein 2-like n=1 Tax=Eriocheir sinensis TaxID=95602 RepID=UPI0021C94061|nr:heme-binding protein 2-like [Eriocheir sinensis]
MLVLTLLLQALTVAFCLESAPFEVIGNGEMYEERIYPAQKWVTTSFLSISHDEAGDHMFHDLFNYIDGQNDAGIKVDMTAPVTILVQPGEGPNCENNFTESFYVPAAHQDNPPTPTNPDVYIEERPELHVFSRRFHGFANDEDFISNAAALLEELLAAGVEGLNLETYYTAEYDSPYAIFNRTNEVWIMKN